MSRKLTKTQKSNIRWAWGILVATLSLPVVELYYPHPAWGVLIWMGGFISGALLMTTHFYDR
jgi:hypothetical protein